MTLGNMIQLLREEHHLSQKELANLVGVPTGTIAEWEADETVPDLVELASLSKTLNVSSDVLLNIATRDVAMRASTTEQATLPKNKKHKKTGWIISVATLCIVFVVAFVILWSQGIFNSEPLLFSEDTAKIEAADASVVTVFCYDYEGKLAATGSGFVAFDETTIITNYHVMASAYTCKVSTNQDISYEVSKILCYSKMHDIAILQLSKDTDLQPLVLGNSTAIKKGETVVAIGSPLGIKNTVSTGVLSGRLMEDNMDVLQFTAPISNGSSGGALFDENGNVIGITYASYVDGQNLNLAIPIELASNLYDSKQTAKKVSAICIEEHPYVSYLNNYKNIPVVTLADLKQTPEKYDEQIVRLSIYVSSWGKDSKQFWDQDNWYLSEKNDISLNFEYDENISIPARGIAYKDSPVITCQTESGRSEYIDDSIVPGDKIEIVAYFEFCPEGEPSAIDGVGLPWPYDMANLESILIWKE